MSPKSSRPRAVSAQSKPQSVPPQTAGSDGDRRHDQAAEPSSEGIASNAESSLSMHSPLHEFPPAREGHWIDHIDALNYKTEQLKALVHALHCVAYCEGQFFSMEKVDESIALEQIHPLSLLGQRLCDEVSAHVDVLYRHMQALKEED